jgi:predicted nucleic acid-binding protein
MTRVVVDASVVVKWLFPQRERERDADHALTLLEGLKAGQISLHQPIHWLAEVAAVLVRLSPSTAPADIADLYAMNIPMESGPDMYLLACELAHELNHHVFDTLYHAVALILPDTRLVTADTQYYRKARRRGSITLLSELRPV